MIRIKTGARVLFLGGILLAATGCSCLCGRRSGATTPADALPKIEIACNQPVIVEKGVLSLDVTVWNTTDRPLTLTVCDQMSLCCIRGLHPIVEPKSGEKGMGLLDFCAPAKPSGRKVRLAPGTRFGATLNLPAERLPPHYLRNKGKTLAAYCAFETERGTATSNVIDVEVK